MATAYNKAVLAGRVMSEPEVRQAGNSTVAKFRLVVGRSRKNQQTGQWENDPNQLFIDCEAWHNQSQKRNLPDVIQKYVTKGKEVLVDGRLKTYEWEDRNGGGKRSKILLVIDELQLLGGPTESGGRDESGGERQQGGYGGQSQSGTEQYGGNPDLIPF